jgi:hypothetical protein
MAYRAGVDLVRDVVGFCGMNWNGCMLAGRFLGHHWLFSGNELVDFSVGDWKDCTDYSEAYVCQPEASDLGPTQWTAPDLPEFFWTDKVALMKRNGAPLRLGQAWYTGFEGTPPDCDAMVEAYLPIMKAIGPLLFKRCDELCLKERIGQQLAMS